MLKRLISILMCGVMAGGMLFAAGCGNSSKESKQTYAWPLATCSTEDTITYILAKTFADKVEELSDGEMKIQIYSNSTLGTDRELMESCKEGDIPFVVQSPAPQVSYMPELCVFDLPCAYQDINQVREAIDNPDFMSKIEEVYQEAGYQVMAVSDQWFRVMTSKTPFSGVESLKGQKIRTMENVFHIQFWNSIGANATPMSFSEVYTGLQQGTIDAQENAYEIIVSAKLYEQQKHVIQINVVPDLTMLVLSDEFYQQRTPQEQEILKEAAVYAQEYSREQADIRKDQRVQVLEENGLEITDISEEQRQEILDMSQGVYEAIRAQAGDDLVDAYLEKSNETK